MDPEKLQYHYPPSSGQGSSNQSQTALSHSAGQGQPKAASNYPWIVQDPVLLQRKTDRMNVLVPAPSPTLSRTRSLTRPNRKNSALNTPRPKNILESTPTHPFDPWKIYYNLVTCCVPAALMKPWGMDTAEKQKAWREKVALCVIFSILMGGLGFFSFGLQNSICKAPQYLFTAADVKGFSATNNPNSIVIAGVVYSIASYLRTHAKLPYFVANPTQEASIAAAQGVDVSMYFRQPLSAICQQNLQLPISFACSSPLFPGSVYCHDMTTIGPLLSGLALGPVFYDWGDLANSNYTVFDGRVLDLTMYFNAKSKIFGAEVDTVIRNFLNQDMTLALARVSGNGPDIGQCLIDMFVVGQLDSTTSGCWIAEVILYISFALVLGLVLVKFAFAVYFQWFISHQLGKILKDVQQREPSRRQELVGGKFPITMTDNEGNLVAKHIAVVSPLFRSGTLKRNKSVKSSSNYGSEIHTIMLVTCYSEDENALKTTLDSLAATEYNEDFKLLLIISDGIIKGSGNEKSTPDLILGLLELDGNWSEPEPMSYLAVADGAKQLNMAKVYVAWYNFHGRSVPTILIVKCGIESERTSAKPGNRGKRDSQMILMRFLERVTFNQRLCPLEYDMFLKMNYLMGVTPDHFEIVLMVDADTKVAPDSLARMVACMNADPDLMGLCGETRISNKTESWITRIQVFEYYLSHHLTKAFESMFGSVTCLPGDAWVPILCSPEIISTYSQSVVETLHKKNLLLLGEDRFLTTLMLRTFPRRKLIFVPRAFCKTTVPNTFAVLLSQRRRWINSTVHNLSELLLVNEQCGIFCFSMQFVILMELVGTVTLPAAICFTLGIIAISIFVSVQLLPLLLLAAILGLPAVLILLTTRRVIYIYWLILYLLALPVWNFVLPMYAFWHFDDFSWGETRKVDGDTGHDGHDNSVIGPDAIPLRKWDEWERDRRANIVISYRRRTSRNSRFSS